MAASPLLSTKLQAPPPHSRLLVRPHLQQKLNAGLEKRLTLVAAPAGYGKTSSVAAWIRQQDLPFAWLSLDEEDNDLARFLAYFVAALQSMELAGADQWGRPTLAIAQNPQQITAVTIATPLINEIEAASSPFVLILDDYHLIHSAQIHEFISLLLTRPPFPMHLVIVTRGEPPLPLARLRAQRQLAEIGPAGLRFSLAECHDFLTQVIRLELEAAVVQQLHTRTEGWIVGLQLAALSLRERSDTAEFLAGFSGSHRHLFDYLAAEVLEGAVPEQKEFLLATSILDELCASLCTAVLGEPHTQSGSQAVLESLARAHLFLTAVDDEREWFRYHPLFQEFLQAQLKREVGPDQIRIFYEHAAQWYENRNRLSSSVGHALAAGAFVRAVQLIEQVSLEAWLAGDFASLRYWFNALPDDLIANQARLCLFQAWILSFDGQYAASHRWLKRAGKAVELAPDDEQDELHALYLVFTILLSFEHQSNPAGTMARAQRALRQIPAGHYHWRALAYVALSYSARETGDMAAAEQLLYQALAESRSVHGDYLDLIINHNLVRFQLAQGYFQRAHQTCQQMLQRAEESRLRLFLAAVTHNYLGEIYLEWNRLQSAERHFKLAYEFSQQLGRTSAQISALIGQVWLNKLLGKSDQVIALFNDLEKLRQSLPDNGRYPSQAAYRTLAAMERGQWPVVDHWLTAVQIPPTSPAKSFGYIQRTNYLIWAHAQLARGKPGALAAIPVLEQLQQRARSQQQPRFLVELLTLLAGAQFLGGDLEPALGTLPEALSLAEAENYAFTFLIVGSPMRLLLQEAEKRGLSLPYTRRLLQAFKQNETLPGPAAPVNALLSEREQELLRLVAAGLSNRHAAERLHISINTVKAHLKRINVKLDVGNRTAAVTKAQELGIL